MRLKSFSLTVPLLVFIATGARADTVTVRDHRGVYSVTARFAVRQAPSLVLAVLTDYDRIPAFMPGIKTSVVRERARDAPSSSRRRCRG